MVNSKSTPSLPPPVVVPSQVQPSAKITSLVVDELPSLQAVPGVVGTDASLSLQSSSTQTPSLSASVQPGVVPSQVQPSAKITSLIVLLSPSLQAVPGVVGTDASLSLQSSSTQIPSLSASVQPGVVPSQVQPSAKITSLIVLLSPSLQVVPGVVGTDASLSLQSSSTQTPSLSASAQLLPI